MNETKFAELYVGDVVYSKISGLTYVVTGSYIKRKTLTLTIDVSNPDEWELGNKQKEQSYKCKSCEIVVEAIIKLKEAIHKINLEKQL